MSISNQSNWQITNLICYSPSIGDISKETHYIATVKDEARVFPRNRDSFCTDLLLWSFWSGGGKQSGCIFDWI